MKKKGGFNLAQFNKEGRARAEKEIFGRSLAKEAKTKKEVYTEGMYKQVGPSREVLDKERFAIARRTNHTLLFAPQKVKVKNIRISKKMPRLR